jgi:CDP-diacylglycerol--glycerol-3-phosphate 3-phosphatidyltransferase
MPSNKKTKRQLLRNIADGLSISRIFLSLLALAFVDRQPVFLILFALSGLTDLADGPLARLSHLPSERGALLDTLADLPLTVAVLIYFIRSYGTLFYTFLPWIIMTVAIRITAIIVTAYRFKAFAILHTWLNKVSGLLLFLLPFGLIFMPLFQDKLLAIVITMASVSALEELGIELTAQTLNRNRKGTWDRR